MSPLPGSLRLTAELVAFSRRHAEYPGLEEEHNCFTDGDYRPVPQRALDERPQDRVAADIESRHGGTPLARAVST